MADKKRTKGTGRIFVRNKKYYLRITVNGLRKDIALGVDVGNGGEEQRRKAELKAKSYQTIAEAKSREELAAHVAVARKLQRNVSKITLSDVWTRYIKETTRPDSGPQTLKGYRERWEAFANWLGQTYPAIKNLDEITAEAAKAYAAHMIERKLSPASYNKYLNSLKLIFNVMQDHVEANPFDGITRRATAQESHAEFTEDDLSRILTAFDNKEIYVTFPAETRLIILLGAYTGMRLKDCALIEWNKIDLKKDYIRCRPAKTARHETWIQIPLHPRLRSAIMDAKKWKTDTYLLPQTAERYGRNPSGVSKSIVKFFEKLKFDVRRDKENKSRRYASNAYGFHSLRHTFVSFCASAGVPMAAVQAIVGHGSPAMTWHYTHVGDTALKTAIAALPDGDTKKKAAPDLVTIRARLEAMNADNWQEIRAEILKQLPE